MVDVFQALNESQAAFEDTYALQSLTFNQRAANYSQALDEMDLRVRRQEELRIRQLMRLESTARAQIQQIHNEYAAAARAYEQRSRQRFLDLTQKAQKLQETIALEREAQVAEFQQYYQRMQQKTDELTRRISRISIAEEKLSRQRNQAFQAFIVKAVQEHTAGVEEANDEIFQLKQRIDDVFARCTQELQAAQKSTEIQLRECAQDARYVINERKHSEMAYTRCLQGIIDQFESGRALAAFM